MNRVNSTFVFPEDEDELISWTTQYLWNNYLDSQVLTLLLENEAYSFHARQELAQHFKAYDQAVAWGYAHFEDKYLRALITMFPLTEELVPLAAINPNWNWESIKTVRGKDRNTVSRVMAQFLEHLPDEVLEKVLTQILQIVCSGRGYHKRYHQMAFLHALEPTVLLKRARNFYGLDEDIPDDWVLKAAGVTP